MDPPVRQLFAAAFGGVLGLALVKFGNPPIMPGAAQLPSNWVEWIYFAWPLGIGYALLALVILFGLVAVRRMPPLPKWILSLPAVWLVWQFIAGTQSIRPDLTSPTLTHFVACVACFYAAAISLSPVGSLRPFWLPFLAGFGIVLAVGWQQHFGGLETSRQYFMLYVYPTLETEPPEDFMKRINSTRIFSTLFYPNSLAGALILLTPVAAGLLKRARDPRVRWLLGGLLLIAAGGCLAWSGSKGGWLIALFLGVVAFERSRFPQRPKWILIGLIVVAGLAGFIWKYAGFFQKGATSVTARFDYWEAGLKIAVAHPIVGTGPGTFGPSYASVKRPESEMTRLTHNDFLQQASDSGAPGFVLYAALVGGVLGWAGRRVWRTPDSPAFWIWLGLLGWALHSMIEFSLYIPASAWTGFALMGLLVGRDWNRLDTPAGET